MLWASLLLFLLIGCKDAPSAADKGRAEGILLLGNATECSRLDPQLAFHASERRVQMALFEPLVGIGPNLEILPALAEDWTISSDETTYTFYLRKNAQWSNGEPLTAEDCVFAFEHLLSPTLGAAVSYFAFIVEGAEAFNQGALTDFNKVGVKALNNHTLEIKLTQPAQHFLRLMAYTAFVPIPKKVILSLGSAGDPLNYWDSPQHIVSSGPFRMKEWSLGSHLTLEKNPHYWDQKNVYLNGIIFYPIADARTEEQAFQNNQLHLTYGLPPHRLPYYQTNEPDVLHLHYDHSATELFLINTQKPPLDKSEIRQALNLALDRKALAGLFLDKRVPALGFVPSWIPNYQTPEGLLPFDIPKAQALLQQAGYPQGEGAPPITLIYSASTPYGPIAEALQAMWKNNLGLNIDIEPSDAKTNFYNIISGNFHLGRLVWRVECADAGIILGFFASNCPANPTGWQDAQYDNLLAQGFAEKDLKKREHYFQQAETRLMEGAPIIPLAYQPVIYLQKPYVQGWKIQGAAFIPYKNIYFEPI